MLEEEVAAQRCYVCCKETTKSARSHFFLELDLMWCRKTWDCRSAFQSYPFIVPEAGWVQGRNSCAAICHIDGLKQLLLIQSPWSWPIALCLPHWLKNRSRFCSIKNMDPLTYTIIHSYTCNGLHISFLVWCIAELIAWERCSGWELIGSTSFSKAS